MSGGQLCSQPSGPKATEEIRGYKENIIISTDRDIYITGEKVWVKVYKFNGIANTTSDLSKVVYLELLDKNNFPLRQLKVKTQTSSGSSVFFLPDNISSGNYIIRAYSNWMKNFSPDLFSYKFISVINPFESIDHIKLPSGMRGPYAIRDTDTVRSTTGSINDDPVKKDLTFSASAVNGGINYKVTLGKTNFGAREKVSIEISASNGSGKPVESDFSVSVTKPVLLRSSGIPGIDILPQTTTMRGIMEKPQYLAELEGNLLSGYLRLKATDEPLKNTPVSLSFVGKTARCQFGKTNETGMFNFVVKESGLNEIVIQPLSPDVSGYYIELLQPFISTFSNISIAPFYLDSTRIDDINRVVIATQINNIYQPFGQVSHETVTKTIPDFFGKPENTIKMSDYIELTSLREVVKEIMPNVYTLRQNGKYDFKLINKFRGQPFENKPLVLVDGVPVYDFEKVLAISSKDIERADIINTRYFFSENIFDGIISFITRKGNLSVLDFDNSVFRQVFEGCQPESTFYSPDYSSDKVRNNRIPDFRNTLFWTPDLHTGIDGKAKVEFYTSDESSEYSIIVKGVKADGSTGYASASFTVR